MIARDGLEGYDPAEAERFLRELANDPPVEFPNRKDLIRRGEALLAGRDPDDLVPAEVDQMLQDGVPQATREQYAYQWARFIHWCGTTGREHLPPTVATMRYYIWSHWSAVGADGRGRGRRGRPYATATVSTAVYSVSAVLQWLGHASPMRHPSVRAQMKGYHARWSGAGHKPDQAHPLLPEESVAMARACDLSTVQGLRLATMMRLQYDLGARESEIIGLDLEDLSWIRTGDTPQIRVWVRKSKTSTDGRDLIVEAVPGPDADVDPALLLGRYVDALTSAGIETGPLFTEVNRGDPRKDGRLAGSFRVGLRITRAAYQAAFGRIAVKSGVDLDPKTKRPTRRITTHAPRRGMITAARTAGMLGEQVAPRTGHSLRSGSFWDYFGGATQTGDENAGTRIRTQAAARPVPAAPVG